MAWLANVVSSDGIKSHQMSHVACCRNRSFRNIRLLNLGGTAVFRKDMYYTSLYCAISHSAVFQCIY
nr:MAG TPA: hypothetical protein [Caudoviricetes sp.]